MAYLVGRKGSLVHLANEYAGVSLNGGHLGGVLGKIARYQNRKGLDVRVVIPKSKDQDLKGFANHEGYLFKEIDGVKTYVIEREISELYPRGKNAIAEYEDFARGFVGVMNEGTFGKVSIVHAHDYGMGVVLPCINNGETIKKIFTIYDPAKCATFPLSEAHPPEYHDSFNGYAHFGEYSGLKAGIKAADISTFWSAGFLDELCRGTYGGFIKDIEKSKKWFDLESHWRPSESAGIPNETIDAFTRAYLRALYGEKFQFTESLLEEDMNVTVEKMVVQVHERRPDIEGRGPLVEQSLWKTMKGKAKALEAVRRISEEPMVKDGPVSRALLQQQNISLGHLDNIGAILQMFEALFKGAYKKDAVYYALLNGGVGERLMNVCMAAGGIKGEVRAGHTTLSRIVTEYAQVVANQLPNGGKGFVVFFGNDNIMIPYGEMRVGKGLLADAKQKIFLFMKPRKIKGEDPELLKKSDLKGLGLAFDDETGYLSWFYEKLVKDGEFDVDKITTMVEDRGRNDVLVNTFYMAMTTDAAKRFYELYSVASKRNGRPLDETYKLNWSLVFIEAYVHTRAEWDQMFTDKKYNDYVDKTKTYRKIDNKEDWMYLWEAANKMKNEFGNMGVVNIGEQAIWFDLGNIRALKDLYFKLVSPNIEERALFRKALKMPLDNIDPSLKKGSLKGVTIEDEDTVSISHSVFANGGKVGKNCVIIDSYFEDYIDIPNNTIIIGSHIYTVDRNPPAGEPRPPQNAEKLIYCVHRTEERPFWFKNHTAVASMFLHDGSVRTGEFPLELTGKEKEPKNGPPFEKDKILRHYDLNGDMTEQEIKGMGVTSAGKPMSVKGSKYEYSLQNSLNAYEKLCDKIERYLGNPGLVQSAPPVPQPAPPVPQPKG